MFNTWWLTWPSWLTWPESSEFDSRAEAARLRYEQELDDRRAEEKQASDSLNMLTAEYSRLPRLEQIIREAEYQAQFELAQEKLSDARYLVEIAEQILDEHLRLSGVQAIEQARSRVVAAVASGVVLGLTLFLLTGLYAGFAAALGLVVGVLIAAEAARIDMPVLVFASLALSPVVAWVLATVLMLLV